MQEQMRYGTGKEHGKRMKERRGREIEEGLVEEERVEGRSVQAALEHQHKQPCQITIDHRSWQEKRTSAQFAGRLQLPQSN